MKGEVFSPATLADRWGVSTTLIYDLLNSGQLPGFRLGKLWRIRLDDVLAYEAESATKQPSVWFGGTEQRSASAIARQARLSLR